MKLGILTDTHLSSMKYSKMDHGKKVSRFLTRQFQSLEWSLNEFKRRGITEIIHCGDMFDSVLPMIYTIVKTRDLFKDFTVHAIKGNHDDSCLLFDEKMSALDLLGIDSINVPKNMVIDGVNFVFIPWGYEVVEELISDDNKNVLIAHGFPRNYGEFGSVIKNTEKFDLVITGHYHRIDEFKKGNTRYLNPGALSMGRNESGDEPSIWVLDTETLYYERIKIKGGVVSIVLDSVDEDTIIGENVYTINVDTMPDQKLIRVIRRKALDVQFRPRVTQQEHLIQQNIDDFWDYVDKNNKEYKSEFTRVIEELESEA